MSHNLTLYATKDPTSEKFPLFQMNSNDTKFVLSCASVNAHRYTLFIMDEYLSILSRQYSKRNERGWLMDHEISLMRFLLANPNHYWTST